jgi:uncharacterized membrane protein
MRRQLAIFLTLGGSALGLPARAFAQAQNPSSDTWFGPWFMWGGWSSWWWICPLMVVLMILAMILACRFMCSSHYD